MKTITKKMTIFMVAFALTFTSLPMLTGEFTAHAVSAPRKVTTFNAQTYSSTSVRLTWKKVGKPSGYAIFVNGKLKKKLPNKNKAYNVPKLKPATTYKFTIKAYNTYKQKQYYNSKTKKWQTKKPAASQWKGKKTRKVNAPKYGPVSVTRKVSTGPAKVSGIQIKEINKNSFRLNWTKQTKACTGYVIYINNKEKVRLGADNDNYKISGLSAGTTYTCKIHSYMKVGKKNINGPAVSRNITTISNGTDETNDTFSVYMDDGTWDLEDGDTISISAKSTNSITWSSDNAAVATVTKNSSSQGAQVKFLKAGTVKITASAKVNGSTETKIATYTVTDSRSSTEGDGNTGSGGKTWRDKAKNWYDTNTSSGQHSDAYIVYKAFQGIDAVHAMYPDYYWSCGMDSSIIDEICQYKGVDSKSRSCAGDDILYNPTNPDSHINNLVKINGTYYVVDGNNAALIMYYNTTTGHPIKNTYAAAGGNNALKSDWQALGMTNAEINELGIPD